MKFCDGDENCGACEGDEVDWNSADDAEEDVRTLADDVPVEFKRIAVLLVVFEENYAWADPYAWDPQKRKPDDFHQI